jgi:hypothetical protein
MKFIKTMCAIGVVAASVNAGNLMAKVSAEEAAKLGNELTPLGAIKAGNAEGTIPAWTGGLTKIPAGYVKGSGDYIDPYADDKILFTITKANMADYADKLSEGQKKMLTTYDTFKINVYPTQRSLVIPDEVAQFAKNNALNVELVDGGNGLTGMEGVVPFPIPKSGLDLVWNQIMRYRGGALERHYVQVTPTANGTFAPIEFVEEFSPRYKLSDIAKNKDDNVFWYFKQQVTAPARLAGNVLLIHETINQVKEPRRAWVYNAGQRRVRRAPQVAYDGPGTASDGLRTTDNFDGWNGAPDRYNWTLDGMQEMYVPYNSYKVDDKSLKYKDVVKPGHLNPDYLRSELHRVWKVTATLKDGQRHIYSKRVMYFDEDSYSMVMADMYDGRGELWRYQEIQSKLLYDFNSYSVVAETVHDLISGRYITGGLANEIPKRYTMGNTYKTKDFTPAALRRSGKR